MKEQTLVFERVMPSALVGYSFSPDELDHLIEAEGVVTGDHFLQSALESGGP